MIKKLFNYYKSKPAYSKKCKDFMIWCGEDENRQQVSGGYIGLAKNKKIIVNYLEGKPNQKWHLLYSYCYKHKKMSGKVGDLKCPELIIWMCEVADIEITDIDINIMKEYILKKGRMGRNDAGLYLWKKNKDKIFEKVNKYGT